MPKRWIVPWVLLFAACGSDDTGGGSTKLSTAGFDKSCSADTDCVAVFEGNACAGCRCDNAAIAKSAEKDYRKERAIREDRCTNVPPCDADCAQVSVVCNAGTCEVAP